MNTPTNYTFILVKENVEPSIAGRRFPYTKLVPAYDEIYDSKLKEPRLIQLTKREKTIYVDEFVSEDSNKKREAITFNNGFKIVDAKETKLLAFMRASNYNRDCANRMPNTHPMYYEFTPGKMEKQNMIKDIEIMDAKQAAYNLKFNDMIAYARVLGIRTEGKDADEIRYNLSVVAQRDPVKFMTGINSPNTKRSNNILEAVDKQIIIKDDKNRCIKWANNNQAILTAPVGQDLLTSFVEWSFGSKDGEIAYEAIVHQLKSIGTERFMDEDEVSVVDMDEEDLVNTAIEKGVITKEIGGMLMFEGKTLMKGVNPTVKKVKANTELKAAIQSAIG